MCPGVCPGVCRARTPGARSVSSESVSSRPQPAIDSTHRSMKGKVEAAWMSALTEVVQVRLVAYDTGVGECRCQVVVGPHHIPTHVVRMQVGNEDRINLLRRDALGGQIVHQFSPTAADGLDGPLAIPGVQQDGAALRPDQVAEYGRTLSRSACGPAQRRRGRAPCMAPTPPPPLRGTAGSEASGTAGSYRKGRQSQRRRCSR